MTIQKRSSRGNFPDFSAVLPLFSPNTLGMEVDDIQMQDVFSDIRKHSKLLDPVKAENYQVLMNLEEQIMKKYGIQRSEITPVKYFFGIMTQLNTQTKYYRSVGRAEKVLSVAFVSAPEDSP